ncbi:CHAT domain-containing protein [Leptolyngbya cf. ectocarpi LEGE 11479]|uniref:CHAT domain-containing protein n=2 Tax=Leptolyngbya ectocarpi TaxID=1202 RepID=A0A928ZWQ3_LEPEC|nr:CHAT domain-containing protein [Leptolyngbya cf. ectocarpi LEGE 11479]
MQLIERGRSAYQTQQIDQAIAAWQAAAQQFEQQGDPLQQALALSYLSMAYQYRGDWPQAEATIAHSLEQVSQWQAQAKKSSHTDRALIIQGQVFNTRGALQFSQGSLSMALQSWQRAGEYYQQAGDIQRYTGSLINRAWTLQGLGYFLKARERLDQIEAQLDQATSEIKVLGLHSLGDTLLAIGDLETAETVYKEGLQVAQNQSLAQQQAPLLLSLGRLAQRQQQPDAALTYYRQAAAATSDVLQQAQVQVDEYGLLVATESWSAAETLAKRLPAQLKALPPSRASLYTQARFAHQLIQSGRAGSVQMAAELLGTTVQQSQSLGDRYAEAYAMGYLGNAYEVTQQWDSAKDLTKEALLIAQMLNANDIAYQWQWQLGRILKVQDKTEGAIAAYKTAFQSLQSLRYDLAAIAPDQQFSFRESVEPVYREYVDLLLSPDAGPDRLKQAREVIESLQIAELNNFFQSACIEGQAVALDEVEQTNAAVIYPIMLRDRIEVIVSLPDQALQHHSVPVSHDQVDAALSRLRRQMIRPFFTPATTAAGEVVYNWLIRPIESDLHQSGVETLVFVLDGGLRSVPMSVLYSGEHYLIEDYSVALTPGLQLIAPRPLQQQGFETLAGGLTASRYGFSALENVRLELEKIEETVPSQVLLDENFTSEALREKVEALPYPIVHLATHGQFSSRAEDTFILAWDRPLNVNEISSILRTGDQTRQTPIEMLILSACQTAAGDDQAALGLAGVAVRAGARSTIASLWNLDDASGALLVGNLYESLVNPDTSKAEALRQAQLALLHDPDYRAPYFWAAFVLVGNWL